MNLEQTNTYKCASSWTSAGHITVNISTGTPEEAKEWAEYCAKWYENRGLDLPLMYWQIGNEHYGHWEIGNMTGEMYVDTLKEFVPGIRFGYPNASIIALGPKTGNFNGCL